MEIGIIGAGRWAGVHKEALECSGAKLSAVLVSTEESRKRIEKTWGIRASLNMQDFLSYGTEAVIVASPNYLHAEHSIAALNAGKHVLVEKPMAIIVEDCDRMLAAAKRSGKVLAVGLEMRIFTLFQKVKALLDEGAIGKPIHLKLDLWRRPYSAGSGGWKSDPAKLGSSILEEPVHYLDLARWYLLDSSSEPERLQAWANSRASRDYLLENLDVRLEYANGTSAIITRSIAAYGHTVNLQIVGERGSLDAEWSGVLDMDTNPYVSLYVHNSGDREKAAEEIEVTSQTGHAFDVPKQTAAFLEAIRTGSRPAATGEDGKASVVLCLAVETSLSTYAPVSLSR